jgi:hypothetical protein
MRLAALVDAIDACRAASGSSPAGSRLVTETIRSTWSVQPVQAGLGMMRQAHPRRRRLS